MNERRSYLSVLRRVALTAALAALLAPAGSAEAKKAPKKPVVTKVRPMQANVGDTITIYGRNFVRGKARNTVVFKRQGARAIFVKADVATLRQIRVVLPARLSEYLAVKDGNPTFTRFQLRVLAKRFGKAYTRLGASPMIGPEIPKAAPGAPGTSTPAPGEDKDGDCDGDGVKNAVDTDDDGDLLTDVREGEINLDACKRDTDGDGVEDGYELRSARDLNDDGAEPYLPYPHKLPYPNPLFADSGSDYDGDGLTLLDEYKLWNGYGTRDLGALNYSDGEQYTMNIATVAYDKQQAFLAAAAAKGFDQAKLLDMDSYVPREDEDLPDPTWTGFPGTITDVERYYYDIDHNGLLSDDERDEDADGLPNWNESHGYMTPKWWTGVYKKENPFTTAYAGTKIDDGDTDGDGVVDGADDQDHDDMPNVRELSRRLAAGEVNDGDPWVLADGPVPGPEYLRAGDGQAVEGSDPWRGWVHPFNPCLPNRDSRTCPRYIPASNPYPPFDFENGEFYRVSN